MIDCVGADVPGKSSDSTLIEYISLPRVIFCV
jgi:hypothetical protein